MQRAIDVKEHKRLDSPTRKSISRYGRHKFEISRTISFFLLHETLYTVRIIRFMLSKTVPEIEHLEHCFCPLSIRLAIAGISITIPSILVADTCTHLKVSTMAYC